MPRHQKWQRALVIGMSALAGYIDAIGYLQLGGFFVSFMSGNSTRLAIGFAGHKHAALVAGGLIGMFLLGVIFGSVVGQLSGRRYRGSTVLGLVALLLVLAAALHLAQIRPGALAAMAFAMGAENAVFERHGEANIGVTYMTGVLVKLGQHIARALLGGSRTAWLTYLFPWLGMIAGATVGAFVYPVLNLTALWPAAGVAAIAATIPLLVPMGWRAG
ncbi:MAG TPA: YoaK family protein [Pararhizobium sp.]|nr:YoaK family protein [Pararhizobium sp.]